jgi:hypothetical protein
MITTEQEKKIATIDEASQYLSKYKKEGNENMIKVWEGIIKKLEDNLN